MALGGEPNAGRGGTEEVGALVELLFRRIFLRPINLDLSDDNVAECEGECKGRVRWCFWAERDRRGGRRMNFEFEI